MMHSHDYSSHAEHEDTNNNVQSWLFSRTGIVTILALSILGFLIYTGHSAHLLGIAPYLLLLLCPLMHIFMHGHGKHNHDANENEVQKSRKGDK